MEIIKKYNLITKKKFGQNFLTSENILDKIVAVAGNIENKNILEIGPGPGGLTTSILKQKPKKLISVEIDNDLFEILKVEFDKYNNFEVINEDALKINESEYFNNNINVIANLPYNVGTNLLLKWLNNIQLFESFTLLLQKEVVERIVAKPCTKDYGRLSIITQALCDAKKMFDIKPESFIPPPKVMSSVVYIKPKQNIENINIKKLGIITQTLFSQRRKKIKNAINLLLKQNFINSNSIINIDLDKRAEELSVDEYIDLSK